MTDFDNDLDFDEVLAEISGQSIEEYRAEVKLREHLFDKSQKYIETDVEHWPKIIFNWNINSNGQRFSLDGMSIDEFNECCPEGFCLGYVDLKEFDKYLCHYSRRDEGELWTVGCQSKLARLIVYLSEARPIAPPLVKPLDNRELILQGGHHRYALAKVVGLKRIPIHVEPLYKDRISRLLSISWV